MLDSNDYTYEDSWENLLGDTEIYFNGPEMEEGPNWVEDDLVGIVRFYTIRLTLYSDGERSIEMSPTVESAPGYFEDVDWVFLQHGIDYDDDFVDELLEKAGMEDI